MLASQVKRKRHTERSERNQTTEYSYAPLSYEHESPAHGIYQLLA
jgi:hypothetical protein